MNIFEICKQKLEEKGLINDERYLKRLKWEQEEILAKDKESYFQNLFSNKIKYPFNQNNLLIVWLLDIAADFDIDKDPKCEYGDFPDIDSDFIPQIRNYIKEEWAPKTFGEEYVCNIGNYTTFGMKSALIDMARVHGLPREEILALTKSLDAKDDDGNAMTWDAAMKLYPELKKYCEDHPDVAEAAKKLLNRNRGMGVHAGGLIISRTPLPDLVPLVKRKDNPQASAWVEGLHGQDLQPVGLVKFDLLVVSNLLQIAKCCELVKTRHNLKGICALEGQSDWTDVEAWRNDPLSLGMADMGDLKGIFQFDSETVRSMCRNGGVDRFEDLVAYTSLNRPAALTMKMQERYIERKKGREKFSLHPLLEPILGTTYGVMCVHEDTLVSMYDGTERKISNVVAGDLIHTFNEEKKIFESKKVIWAGYTKTDNGKLIKLKNGLEVITTNDHKILTYNGWKNAEDLKKNDLIAIQTKTRIDRQNFRKSRTQNIKLSTLKQCAPKSNLLYVEIQEIKNVHNKKFYDISVNDNHNFVANGVVVHNCYQEQVMKILNVVGNIPLKDCEIVRKAISKKKVENFLKYKEMFIVNGQKNLACGEKEINDLWLQTEAFSGYGFNLAHAAAYTYISSYLLYLKSHYPHEFYTSILSCENLSDKIKEYKMEAKLHNVKVCRLDINKSKVTFDLQGDEIYFGLSNVKGIGEAPATRIVENQPYSGFEDFLDKFGTDASVLKPLIGLRCFKEKDPVTLWRFADVYKTYFKKREDKKKRHIISMEKYDQEFKELFPEESMKLSDITGENPYEEEYWKKYNKDEVHYVETNSECSKDEEGAVPKVVNGTVTLECGVTIEKEIVKYYKKVKVKKNWNRLSAFKTFWNKRKRSLEKYGKATQDRPKLEDFVSPDDPLDSLEEEFKDSVLCENKYYGFAWIHPLEFSPDYKGNLTFDNLKNNSNIAVGAVEIKILKATKTKSKKGTEYYSVVAEDATGQQNRINVWQDDWERWGNEFKEGNLLRVRLQPPSGGFNTFMMESNQGKLRWRGQKKYAEKRDDIRVIVMREGVSQEL